MKKILLPLFVIFLLTSCTSSKHEYSLEEREMISWEAFSKKHSSTRSLNHKEQINEFLDTWCGSVEEENAFLELGIEPY
ncbi:MAG: hypothetical protein J1D77_03515 [Muribaculaceae bacterium]|nr:hypothetical protein [Muribaculaceae bacterium]